MSKVTLNNDKARVANAVDAHVGVECKLLESCDAFGAAKFAVYAARQCLVEPTEEMKGVLDAIDAFKRKPDSWESISDLAVNLNLLMLFDEKSLPAALCWASKATAQAALAMLTYSQDEGDSAPLARKYALQAYRFTLESIESTTRESTAQVPPGYVYGRGNAARKRLTMAAAEARLMAELNKLAHPKAADLPLKRE